MDRRWKTLASRELLRRWWMTLREDRVQLPNGHVLDEFHVAEYPDWACVVPLTDDGQAVLVEQYRYGVDGVYLEFPAGAVDPQEPLLDAARRELREETGYEAARWTALGSYAVEPSRHTNFGHVFLAEGAQPVGTQALDVSEDLSVVLVPAHTLPDLVAQGRIVHGVHVAATFQVARLKGW